MNHSNQNGVTQTLALHKFIIQGQRKKMNSHDAKKQQARASHASEYWAVDVGKDGVSTALHG